MNWTRQHVTLKSNNKYHMNYVLVATWGAFKTFVRENNHSENLSRRHIPPPLSPPDIGTDHQACLAGTQQ